jgi:HSP20 family protein
MSAIIRKEKDMSIMRWDPFGEMQSMFAPMFRSSGLLPRLSTEGDVTFEWAPNADISENEKEYLIRASLPGVKKEDIKVHMQEGMITLAGERRQEQEDTNEKFHRVESVYGSFSRSFGLPDNIRGDAVKSEYKDGVLIVHIPKAEKEKAKQISVQ